MTTTRLYNHVLKFLQHDVLFVVVIKDGNRFQLGRRAARGWSRVWVEEIHERLNYRVVGRIAWRVHRIVTFAGTIRWLVSIRCYNPVLPSELLKIDVQVTLFAFGWRGCVAIFQCTRIKQRTPLSAGRVNDQPFIRRIAFEEAYNKRTLSQRARKSDKTESAWCGWNFDSCTEYCYR